MKDTAPTAEMPTVLLGEQTQKQWPFSVVRAGRKARRRWWEQWGINKLAWDWGSVRGWSYLCRIIEEAGQNHQDPVAGHLHPTNRTPQIGSCIVKGIINECGISLLLSKDRHLKSL